MNKILLVLVFSLVAGTANAIDLPAPVDRWVNEVMAQPMVRSAQTTLMGAVNSIQITANNFFTSVKQYI